MHQHGACRAGAQGRRVPPREASVLHYTALWVPPQLLAAASSGSSDRSDRGGGCNVTNEFTRFARRWAAAHPAAP